MKQIKPKPKGLQIEYASQFKDPTVAAAYKHRQEHADALFPLLADLIVGQPRIVLDAGCGTGFVARPLVPLVDRVDAVDFSAAMLEIARTLPNGDYPNIRWIHGPIEEVELSPPYGLVTAGASLHWMEWSVVMPRFRQLLQPGGVVALVGGTAVGDDTWWQELLPVIQHHSTNKDFQPYNTVDELTSRGLFKELGRVTTEPVSISKSVPDYIESIHARNGFSRDRMTPEQAATFDAAATEILTPHTENGKLHWQYKGRIVWGEPDPQP